MHIHFLDPYRYHDSLIHHLDARVKLGLTLAFILTCALLPAGVWAIYILLLAIDISVALLSRLGVGYVLKRSILLASPFLLAVLPLPFTVSGQPIVTFRVDEMLLIVSGSGLERMLSIGLKSWLSVQAAVILASTTQFPDLLAALRAFKTPRLLAAIIGLMWRYLFVIADEALRLMRARQARSGEAFRDGVRSGGTIFWRARVTGGMAGSLFLRSLERSDRIYHAMISRGYDGEARELTHHPLTAVSWLILGAGLFVFLFLLVFGLLLG